MSQKTTGIYRLIGIPRIYRAVQEAIGGAESRRKMVEEHMRPPASGRILDLGCGSADILQALPPQCTYVGVDANPRHIEAAREAYGSRGTFLCGDFSLAQERCGAGFDLIIMLGLLHHLDDTSAKAALGLAANLLALEGRLFTLDPCRAPGQHPVARFLVDRDSGKAVRDESGYRDLARTVFPAVELEVRHDLLRFPYTLCFMSCWRVAQKADPTFLKLGSA